MKAKYEQLADHLRQTVLDLDPGQRLPSIRQIGRARGVSQFTVQRALELLEQEGYVTRRSAIGVYSTRPHALNHTARKLEKPRVVVLVPEGWTYQMPELIRAALAERGFLSHIHFYDLAAPANRWLPRIRYEGVILIGWSRPEVLAILQRKNIPFVAQGTQYAEMPVDHTCGDEKRSGAIAAQHLVDLGHQRLAVLVNEPDFPEVIERRQGFIDFARSQGIDPIVYDCHTRVGDDATAAAAECLQREFAKGPPTWTALLAISSLGAMAALHVLHQRDIRVPHQVSVIAGDERPEAAYLCPALTTVAFNLQDRARGLVEILEKRLAGDRSDRIRKTFAPYLIRRKSTAPPEDILR
ncbi:MAG: LacI family transcriptional regulator [Phycisphaerae bacterium]|nr:LacI family transcriptional regulator [Phycisphaerae bacterium]